MAFSRELFSSKSSIVDVWQGLKTPLNYFTIQAVMTNEVLLLITVQKVKCEDFDPCLLYRSRALNT